MTQLQAARAGRITAEMVRAAIRENVSPEFVRDHVAGERSWDLDAEKMAGLNLDLPLAAIRELCRSYGVHELSVFGSSVSGQDRPDSDLDLLVEFEPQVRVGFLTLARLARELSGVLNRKVDLVPKDGLNPRIRDEVLSKAEVLFAA